MTIKFSKKQVSFEHPAKGMDHCHDCKHYLGGRCSIVSGAVLAADWCSKFDKKTPTEIVSRTTGKTRSIGHGPITGYAPSDPFASLNQN